MGRAEEIQARRREIYDDLIAWRKMARDRDRLVREALAAGFAVTLVSETMGITRSTIYRIMAGRQVT